MLLIGSFGSQLCFGVFLKPLVDEFGWSRAAASGAMSLMMGVSGLIGVLMGRLTDRYRARTVIAVGTVVGASAFFLLSRMDSLWQFYLYFGVGGGICVGSSYTPVSATVSKWFTKRRSLALGIALMGIGVGQMILSPVSELIISTAGWRTAYIVLAAAVLVCALPALIVMGRRPPSAASRAVEPGGGQVSVAVPRPQGMATTEAARTAPFWMLMWTGLVISAGFYIVAAHIVPAATDVGISSSAAALILTVSSFGGLFGTVTAWVITVRLGNRITLLLLILGEAVGMFLFIVTKSAWSFYVVALIFGFSFGGASPVRQGMVPPLFGLRAVGSILGLAFLAWSIGGIAGPYMAGLIFDSSGDYRLAFVIGGVLLVAGVVSVYLFGSHGDVSRRQEADPWEERRERRKGPGDEKRTTLTGEGPK